MSLNSLGSRQDPQQYAADLWAAAARPAPFRQPPFRLRATRQLSTHPIAIGNVQLLQLFERSSSASACDASCHRVQARRRTCAGFAICPLLIAMCPSACAKCCLTMSRSVDEDFTAWGRARSPSAAQLSNGKMALCSLFAGGSTRLSSATDAEGWVLDR